MYSDSTTSSIFWRTIISDNSFGSENEITSPSDVEFWIDCEASPTNSSRILCGANDQFNGDLLMFGYNNATGTVTELTTVSSDVIGDGTNQPKLFDIEFDSDGDAFVFYIEDTPSDVKYRVMQDSDDDWGNETTFKSDGDWDNGWWIIAHRDPATNDIMVGFESDIGDGGNLSTALWDGSSVGSTTDHGQTSLADAIKLTQDFDFAWEGDKSELIMVWLEPDGDADDSNDVEYNTYTSGTWDSQSTFLTDLNVRDKQATIQMATEYEGTHDKVGMCYTGGNEKFHKCNIWDDTTWGTTHNPSIATETGKGGEGNCDLEWQYGIGDLYSACSGKTDTDITFFTYDESGDSWTSTQDLTSDANQKGTIQVFANPNNNAVGITNEDGKNLDNQYSILCDGTSVCTNTSNWASLQTLNTDSVTSKNNVHDGAFLVEGSGSTTHEISATESVEGSDSHSITVIIVHDINVTESVEGSDSHTVSKEIFIVTTESVEGSDSHTVSKEIFIVTTESVEGSDSHSILKELNIFATESVEGSDSQSISKEINIIAGEVLLGVDSHSIDKEIFIVTTESVEGSDAGTVSKLITITATESVEGSDSHSIDKALNIFATESVFGVDAHSISKELDIFATESVEGSDSHTVSKEIFIVTTESVEGSDSHSIDKALNIFATESVEGSDSHTVSKEIFIVTTESVEGSDAGTVSKFVTITATESVEGSDSHSIGNEINIFVTESVEGTDSKMLSIFSSSYVPDGTYIWINISPPTETRLGGVYAVTCPTDYFVNQLLTNGTLVCAPLPP